ncbi:MAG TPA: alanine--tRNA ligase [Rhodospirillaceae bacterium]|nr:MAG: alanine--tRNA ligase [Alphaproteobacteria bacterium GWF2_58_20]HAU28933.1 alanine--tRNA ligase [Rhodospirillaceae bacterium]
MVSSNDIRKTFLDFFGSEGHAVIESSPLVPRNDPTLMFTTAGMVQFKNVFTGQEKRAYTRATTAQKCVRAGGKHNDLENVGHTSRHHTFFEMLGNFSFGDYFKAEAIDFAWRLITREYGLPKDRLLATVYSEDEEAYGLWKKIAGLPDSKIIRIPTSDNFWSMGDTGPCGPCSEIFFDHGEQFAGGPPGSPDEDGDRFIEIWNLVFMQYEQLAPDNRVNLPKPSIDTGMGLERLAAVLQGKHDNFDTDILRSLILASADITGVDADGAQKVSHRVIADHLRSSAFLISDGVLPSNEGRGYVLRRIMRRAMRHAHMLGAKEPLMHRLVPALTSVMGNAYPELRRAEALVVETLKLEETRFRQTLDRGLKMLEDETGRLGAGQALPGAVAFKLYDTYGFPLDLTQDVLKAEKRPVDVAGFEALMERQREDARKAWTGSGEMATEVVWFGIHEKAGATEFFGYDAEDAEGVVKALLVDGKEVASAKAGDEILLVANQTPFYGESGGQMGDTGTISTEKAAEIVVSDTLKKLGCLHVHVGKVVKGEVSVGDAISLHVDGERRRAIRANHSATHLIQRALQARLGGHVAQKGSSVGPDRLRFDFSHQKALTEEDIAFVEREVNHRIRENADVCTTLMSPEDAMKMGAMALFGEKYGDEVRVVAMGGKDETLKERGSYSIELCGGTHVRRTGDIGLMKIVAETAVAAGVRRIEAVTGAGAFDWLTQRNGQLERVAGLLKTSPAEAVARVAGLMDEKKKLTMENADLRRKAATGGASGPASRKVGNVSFVGEVLEGVSAKDLKPMADELKAKIGSGVVALVAVSEGKASLVVAVTPDLTARFSAVDLVKAGSEALGGTGGGGRPDMAQAGGPNAGDAGKAIEAIEGRLS